jgi:asparagine synthase (glutamine-hydrolysing)
MCGIAGIVTADGRPPAETQLEAMRLALAHRGPDGSGVHVHGDTGLVHTRLAIIDPAGGHQPLFGRHGSAIVGNGEIYNYVELNRSEFAGVNFPTGSDFEPAVNLVERDGTAAFERLRGMFALAVHRPDRGETVLARDIYGIKPLYYTEADGGLAFASEPRALFAAGLTTPRPRADGRAEILEIQNTTGRETIFAGVNRVMPGETLTIRRGRIVARHRRPTLPPPERRPWADIDDAVGEFDRVFEDSVVVHQRSDVPYGLFLSSGLDSAALLTMMARVNAEPVRAFTIGFTGTGAHDERPQARRIAGAVGADYEEAEYNEHDFLTLLPATVWALDEPTWDPAILPTYKLASLARQRVKVILSGEGGDEVFAGYGRYRRMMRPWWLGGRLPRVKGTLAGLGVLRHEGDAWRAGADAIRREAGGGGRTALQAAQAADFHDWLHADLLLKLDRCLMAHGVEGRTPFLDPRVVAFGFALPDRMKVAGGLGKVVLRHWLARHCPAAPAFARKRGFDVPVADWLKRRGGDLGPLVAARPAIAEICRPEAVRDLFRSDRRGPLRAAWVLLFYALWHHIHVKGGRVDGDVFAVLRG